MGFPEQQIVAEPRVSSGRQGLYRHGSTAERANITLLPYLGRNEACTGRSKMSARRTGG